MLDIARDPRWGRIAEGPGEDPYVGARFAEAKVRGFQGADLAGLAATAKHFVAYGASAAGRDYAAVDVSDRALAEIYLPPFRAAVEAGAAAIMPAFTDIAGVPMTANRALLTGTLRDDWGFDGVVVSDYGAIGELVRHGVAADLARGRGAGAERRRRRRHDVARLRARACRRRSPRPRHRGGDRHRRRPRARAQGPARAPRRPLPPLRRPRPETPGASPPAAPPPAAPPPARSCCCRTASAPCRCPTPPAGSR